MRKALLPVLMLVILSVVACKKDKDKKSEYPTIYLHDCVSNIKSYDGIRLCFDNAVDQRCPEDVECFWGGYAIGYFTFTRSNIDHPLTIFLNRDTVVDGYKIKFVNLVPKPRVHGPARSASDVKAELEVTKL